ncbi:MAG: hypothetical protein JO351_12650 [Candidatus Eremiobacteraeota bacterium]|nr:hypothetical protein [Candidatus Eremiobacteraeota bacterium]
MMRCDSRVLFAAMALALASCQGSGFDSGMGGMEPPVTQPGSIGGMNGGIGSMNGNNTMAGPTIGPNGREELTNPGATLAPNEAQYPIGQAPSGMNCPRLLEFSQQYTCTLAFNIPPPPAPGTSAKSSAKPTASPTPSPKPSASSDDEDAPDTTDGDSPTPSPTPLGTMTMQVEPLPRDVPNMTNPNPMFMHITPLVAIRLQSNTDFQLNGQASVQYTLPEIQYAGRIFTLQLYNETVLRGKRTDQLLGNFEKFTTPQAQTLQFSFSTPKVTVRHTAIWLLALYGAQLPPGSTPTPSPTPSPTSSPTGH